MASARGLRAREDLDRREKLESEPKPARTKKSLREMESETSTTDTNADRP
ncbi:hypothetical protein PI125_g21580 [Phytophthora idaei]|nr:hypothetical protein PI125_g21580 [Phytophthora idaei]